MVGLGLGLLLGLRLGLGLSLEDCLAEIGEGEGELVLVKKEVIWRC